MTVFYLKCRDHVHDELFLYLFSYWLIEINFGGQVLAYRIIFGAVAMHTVSQSLFTGTQVFCGKQVERTSHISHKQYISSMYTVIAKSGYTC